MDKLRVLFLTPSVRPLGARRSLVELIRALPPTISPLVVCPADDGIALELKNLGCAVEVLPHGAWRKWSGWLTARFRQVPALRRALERFNPDVIHANEFHIVPQAVVAAAGQFPITGHVRLGITPRQIGTYHMAGCDRIITVSKAVAELFADSQCQDRVRVIYNGVDVGGIAPMGSRVEGFPPEVPAGGIVGRALCIGLFGLISDRKNQLVAAEAVAIANRSGGNVAILLAGDAFKGTAAYGEDLRARLAKTDLSHHSLWLPFQKDAGALYRSIDVNLLISSEEGFGRTIIEAGALGKPSIGSRVGGIPELIRDGETGWLVPERDPAALAEVLLRLCRNRDLISQAGEHARTLVHDQFTIEAHVRRMLDVWGEAREEWRARRK